MSNFVSPVAQETITKLQYLLQNTLYTYAEIVSSLAPESSKELNEELSNVGLKSQVSEGDSNLNQDKDLDLSKNFKEDFISDRVERLGILNDQIQANVDLLPDSSVTRDDLLRKIKLLDSECNLTAKELELLFNKFDSIYNTLKDSLNE